MKYNLNAQTCYLISLSNISKNIKYTKVWKRGMLKVLIDVLMMNVCYYSGWVFVGMTYGDVKHMWHVL